MNHDEAIRLMASERYLLEELEGEQRQQFEEHMFACQDCALDVRAGAAFIDHGKGLVAEEEAAPAQTKWVTPKPTWWAAWLRPAIAVPVMAILLFAVAYQGLIQLPKLNREVATNNVPQLLPSTSLINANTRGGGVPAITVRNGQPFLIFVDVAADPRFTSYIAELHDASGALDWTLPISSEAAKDTLSLRLPANHLHPGAYTLIVRGVTANEPGSEVGRYPFQLNFQSN
jgi:hypothetical protein